MKGFDVIKKTKDPKANIDCGQTVILFMSNS